MVFINNVISNQYHHNYHYHHISIKILNSDINNKSHFAHTHTHPYIYIYSSFMPKIHTHKSSNNIIQTNNTISFITIHIYIASHQLKTLFLFGNSYANQGQLYGIPLVKNIIFLKEKSECNRDRQISSQLGSLTLAMVLKQ